MSKEMNSKYFYEEAKHSRDFEIEHLWQRSVFLAVFLLTIATAYGNLAEKIFFISDKDIGWKQHLFAIGITYVGIIFSILWIMMAKGSKRLYEEYEEALNYFVSRFDYQKDSKIIESEDISAFVNQDCEERYKNMDFPFYGNQPEAKKISDCLISTKGGKYSVSRVNIMIGIVCLIVWIFLNLVHGFLLIDNTNFLSCLPGRTIILDILQFAFIFLLIINRLQFFCKSNS